MPVYNLFCHGNAIRPVWENQVNKHHCELFSRHILNRIFTAGYDGCNDLAVLFYQARLLSCLSRIINNDHHREPGHYDAPVWFRPILPQHRADPNLISHTRLRVLDLQQFQAVLVNRIDHCFLCRFDLLFII